MPEPLELQPTRELLVSGGAEDVGPNVLSVAHWQRLLGGVLYASHSRMEWALLLKRTFDTDVRRCFRCAGRLSVRAVVTGHHAIHVILDALRNARAPPTLIAS